MCTTGRFAHIKTTIKLFPRSCQHIGSSGSCKVFRRRNRQYFILVDLSLDTTEEIGVRFTPWNHWTPAWFSQILQKNNNTFLDHATKDFWFQTGGSEEQGHQKVCQQIIFINAVSRWKSVLEIIYENNLTILKEVNSK